MKRALLFSAILSVTAATSAVAGNWTGWYVGGQLGYGFGEFDLTNFNQPGDFDTEGAVGGMMGGYLQDYGAWVAGVEVQLDGTDLTIASGTTGGNFDSIARIKARGGRDLGHGLLYASAGMAYGDFGGVSGITKIDLSDPGYVVGVGYDYQLPNNWLVGGEYQYHKFNDFGAAGNDVGFGTLQVRGAYRF